MSDIKPNFNLQDNYTANWAITHAMELVPNTTQRMADAFAKLTAEWMVSGKELESFTLSIMEYRFFNNVQYTRPKAEKAAKYLSTKVFAYAGAAKLEESGFAKALVLPPQCDGCRCYTQPWFAQDDDNYKGMRWLTANDDHVCTTPIKTPWGTVNGCKELHNVIISEGPYLGQNINEIKIKLTMGPCPYCGKETAIKKFKCEHCREIIN